MTTTLSSAGGISLVTDGTGPTLQIKGLTAGVGMSINSNSTTLVSRLKTPNETQRFVDDFFYHTDGSTIDLANAANPFQKSLNWRAFGLTGIGADITQTQEWQGGGPGVLKFNNNTRTGTGGWCLIAPNCSFVAGGNPIVFESTVLFDTPSSNSWQFKIGLCSNAGLLLGFVLDPTGSSYLRSSTPAGTTITTTTISSLMNQWITFKVTVNAALNSINFYVNGTLVDTKSTLASGYYYPYVAAYRSATMTNYSFYIDYIEVIRDSNL